MHWETKNSCDFIHSSSLEANPQYLQGLLIQETKLKIMLLLKPGLRCFYHLPKLQEIRST